jgi:acyl-CoA synthetase (AMP-forming)/AMP-acid ligase II
VIHFTDISSVADRLATHLYAHGIRSGDFVAVFMTNSPEMVICVYALAKLGAAAALINTNLRGERSFRDVEVQVYVDDGDTGNGKTTR